MTQTLKQGGSRPQPPRGGLFEQKKKTGGFPTPEKGGEKGFLLKNGGLTHRGGGWVHDKTS